MNGNENYATHSAFNFAFDLPDDFVCIFCQSAGKISLGIKLCKNDFNRVEKL